MNGRIVIRPTDTVGFRCPLCDKKVENILNIIVPLMQSVNGMVQPQQPPAKR